MFQRNSQSLTKTKNNPMGSCEFIQSAVLPDIEITKGNVSLTLSVIILTHLIIILESQSWNMYH